MKNVLFSLIVIASGIFYVPSALAVNSTGTAENPYEGLKVPYELPATINGVVYNHVLGFAHTSTNNWWVMYHNQDNMSYGSSGWINPASPSSENECFYYDDLHSATYHDTDFNANCGGAPSASEACFYNMFSDYTIFNSRSDGLPSNKKTFDCSGDSTPTGFGETLYSRVNFGGASGVDIVGFTSPADTTLITNLSDLQGDFVDFPNLLTDPNGFMGALFINGIVFLQSLIVPSDGYFQEKLASISSIVNERFGDLPGAYEAIQEAGASSVAGSISIPFNVKIDGQPMTLTFLDTSGLNPDDYATLRLLVSVIFVWGFMTFLFRNITTLIEVF